MLDPVEASTVRVSTFGASSEVVRVTILGKPLFYELSIVTGSDDPTGV